MRLSGVRLSIRGLMLIVAVLALPIACLERRARFSRVADHHRERAFCTIVDSFRLTDRFTNPKFPGLTEPEIKRHGFLEARYRRAAAAPWLPVPADPPLAPFQRQVEKQHADFLADIRRQRQLRRGGEEARRRRAAENGPRS